MSFFPLVAGLLSKMVNLPFGRSRWISRYFVLLDSELRFYKDEHAESTSNILNLREIDQVVPAPTLQHPYCLRLEPKQHISMRPWIIDCKSAKNMDLWMSSIQSRLEKYKEPSVKSMILASPEVYRVPTQPLRCTNQQEPLLSRRNKSLAPIVTTTTPLQEITPPVTPSPTGAILGVNTIDCSALISPSIIDQYIKKSSLSPTFLTYKKKFHL